MRVLLAFDKFKDALTARQAGEAAADALRAKHPKWELDFCPLTDGGDGFCETLTHAAGGVLKPVRVTGPRGKARDASFGVVMSEKIPEPARHLLSIKNRESKIENLSTAIVELASASGLAL